MDGLYDAPGRGRKPSVSEEINNQIITKVSRAFPWVVDISKPERWPKSLASPITINYSSHKHKEVTAWLNDHPRFHMHFTPTGSSWMNMVERFFADITGDVIRDGSFQSLKELEDAIGNYMKTRNRAPKRYVWKAEGQKILEKIKQARQKMGWKPYCMSISSSVH